MMMKCASCGKRSNVRDLDDYWALKDKHGNRHQFCSTACVIEWLGKRMFQTPG